MGGPFSSPPGQEVDLPDRVSLGHTYQTRTGGLGWLKVTMEQRQAEAYDGYVPDAAT